MDRWVKAGVLAAVFTLALQLWSTLHGGPAVVDHPLMTAITYGSPVVAGALLLASVWIAFIRPRTPRAKANSASDPVQRQLPGYSEFTRFTIALGVYRNVDLGSGHFPDRIRIELLEITEAPRPGTSRKKDADCRCIA